MKKKPPIEVIPSPTSGFTVNGDGKALAKLSFIKGDLYIDTQNYDSHKIFFNTTINDSCSFTRFPLDAHAEIIYRDRTKSKVEFYYGSGYFSLSSSRLRIPSGCKELIVLTVTVPADPLTLPH